MQRIFHYFDKFKKYFIPNLSLIEFLFCSIILANSLVALAGSIFVWINERDNMVAALILFLDVFFMSVLVIISGLITVIILIVSL
jgi:hypothetical protein